MKPLQELFKCYCNRVSLFLLLTNHCQRNQVKWTTSNMCQIIGVNWTMAKTVKSEHIMDIWLALGDQIELIPFADISRHKFGVTQPGFSFEGGWGGHSI